MYKPLILLFEILQAGISLTFYTHALMEICLHQENITVDAINDMIVTPITRYFDDLPVDIDSI